MEKEVDATAKCHNVLVLLAGLINIKLPGVTMKAEPKKVLAVSKKKFMAFDELKQALFLSP
jgi:hypothetical protein